MKDEFEEENRDDDITVDNETKAVTVNVLSPELNTDSISIDHDKTQIFDEERGLLAFGDLKLSQEQQNDYDKEEISKIQEKLNEQIYLDEAAKYAKTNITDFLQPIVEGVSPEYKLNIVVKEPANN